MNAQQHLILLDFDSATLTTDGTAQSTAGTRAYFSPKRLNGKQYDARADVASAGLVLYEMLVGRDAFRTWNKMYTKSLGENLNDLEEAQMNTTILAMMREQKYATECYNAFSNSFSMVSRLATARLLRSKQRVTVH